jgi:hypothetical protein
VLAQRLRPAGSTAGLAPHTDRRHLLKLGWEGQAAGTRRSHPYIDLLQPDVRYRGVLPLTVFGVFDEQLEPYHQIAIADDSRQPIRTIPSSHVGRLLDPAIVCPVVRPPQDNPARL